MMRIVNSEEVAMDLLVACTPLMIEGEMYSLAAIADISHEKRRRALERIFFHDVINSAGGLESLIEIINEQAPTDIRGDIDLLHASVEQVVEEILAQRDLMAAENDELALDLKPLNSRTVLEKVLQLYANHPIAEYHELRLADDAASLDLVTDPRLLGWDPWQPDQKRARSGATRPCSDGWLRRRGRRRPVLGPQPDVHAAQRPAPDLQAVVLHQRFGPRLGLLQRQDTDRVLSQRQSWLHQQQRRRHHVLCHPAEASSRDSPSIPTVGRLSQRRPDGSSLR